MAPGKAKSVDEITLMQLCEHDEDFCYNGRGIVGEPDEVSIKRCVKPGRKDDQLVSRKGKVLENNRVLIVIQ